jgi:hypothetical protein
LPATSLGFTDCFVQKLDSTGNLVWAYTLGGPGYSEASSIVVDNDQHVLVMGAFADTLDIKPDSTKVPLGSKGQGDVFVAKYSQSPNFSVGELQAAPLVVVYPNPGGGTFYLNLGGASGNYRLTVYDAKGTAVYSKTCQNDEHRSFTIDGPAGVYFVHVQMKNTQSFVRVIKQ